MMRKLCWTLLGVAAVGLWTASLAPGFEGGGRKPSEAPLINYGQHYTGQLNNQEADANHGGLEVSLWRLPPVSTRDEITINWHVLPYTGGSSFPVCMTLLQGVDDFSWGGIFTTSFGSFPSCYEDGPVYSVSGSGSARTTIPVQHTDQSSTYVMFVSQAREDNPVDFENYPYDFSVESPRHYLGLAIKPKKRVHANGVIVATALRADGLPAPDGLPFSLTVTWDSNGVATYSATSIAGGVTFPLALPESAVGERATFVITHPADAYQAVVARLRANVKPAQASAADIACARAVQRAHAIARQFKRLKKNAGRAQGETRRRLRQRARRVGRKLKRAQAEVRAACPR